MRQLHSKARSNGRWLVALGIVLGMFTGVAVQMDVFIQG